MGPGATRVLVASDAGHGFVGKLEEMVTKNKAGKAVLERAQGHGAAAAGGRSSKPTSRWSP